MLKLAMQRAVDEAVRRDAAKNGEAGARARVASRLGVTRQAIEQWTCVPVKRVAALEELSGMSRYEMRPDVYGNPAAAGRPLNGSRRIA